MDFGDIPQQPVPKINSHLKIVLGGIIILAVFLVVLGAIWLKARPAQPREAPEAEAVLKAQLELPFQVLIPAYLPRDFARKNVRVTTDKLAPSGEPMVELIYQNRQGETLTFYEWLSEETETGGKKAAYCMCECKSRQDCSSVEMGIDVGPLRVITRVSELGIMTSDDARAILDTLGPATNRQVYTSLKEVPVTYAAPPGVEIPVNADGVQEVTLVVTPNGYDPEHFLVKKGIPVALTFRQVGQVGCGNELFFPWDDGKSATIYLASPGDHQTLEFTPRETGEFLFHCPHYIYRGVMTVQD